jgi:hypothetical protein
MYHDTAFVAQAAADPRPASAVSHGVGLAGLAGLFAWIFVARRYGLDGPYAALMNVVACGVPMVVWSLAVDRVHRNPSTGIDWANPRPLSETLDISLTKLAGLWLTWGGIATLYAVGRFYWEGNFAFAMWCFQVAAPVVLALSVPWVIWMDRRLIEPKDGAWATGAWLLNVDSSYDPQAIYAHLRSWGVKAFFLAFMLAIVPPGFGNFVRGDVASVLRDPVALSLMAAVFVAIGLLRLPLVPVLLTAIPLSLAITFAMRRRAAP